MSGIGDSGGVSDEEAAWRDLVARFDLPADATAAPPWPAREDLGDAASERSRPEQDTAVSRDPLGPSGRPPAPKAGPAGLAGRAGPAGLPGSVRGPGEDDEAGPAAAAPPPDAGLFGPDPFGAGFFGSDPFGSTAGRAAGTAPDAAPAADGSPARPDSAASGSATSSRAAPGDPALDDPALDDPALDDPAPGAGAAPGSHAPGRPAPGAGTRGAPPARGGKHASRPPGDRARIIRRAAQVPPPARPGDDDLDDERYVPPPPEPFPALDSVQKGAWAGLLGGPAYLLVASLIGHLSDFGALLAIVAFIAGGLTLFLRMSDRPRDDDDDGAVV